MKSTHPFVYLSTVPMQAAEQEEECKGPDTTALKTQSSLLPQFTPTTFMTATKTAQTATSPFMYQSSTPGLCHTPSQPLKKDIPQPSNFQCQDPLAAREAFAIALRTSKK